MNWEAGNADKVTRMFCSSCRLTWRGGAIKASDYEEFLGRSVIIVVPSQSKTSRCGFSRPSQLP